MNEPRPGLRRAMPGRGSSTWEGLADTCVVQLVACQHLLAGNSSKSDDPLPHRAEMRFEAIP